MTWTAANPSTPRLAATVARLAAHTLRDRMVRRVTSAETIPPRLSAITPEWLSEALAAEVTGFRANGGSSATSVRATLAIDYAQPGSGPAAVFAKTTPSLVTRLANGASETSLAGARFMTELRPQLGQIEIPLGYHCVADVRSGRSVQLHEVKDATFLGLGAHIDRGRIEDAVGVLADVHRTLRPPVWLRTQPQWWSLTSGLADLRKAAARFAGAPETPPSLRDAGAVWRAFERSVDLHHRLPRTLLHADPHLANWYVTGDGRMGLCDWQCVSAGHWSLDVAYALVTLLDIPDRRAWERDLVQLYLERSGAPEDMEEAWLRYRQQIPGALLKWAPTLYRPRGFPEMQPQPLAESMLERIATAMTDLDTLGAYGTGK